MYKSNRIYFCVPDIALNARVSNNRFYHDDSPFDLVQKKNMISIIFPHLRSLFLKTVVPFYCFVEKRITAFMTLVKKKSNEAVATAII